MVYIFQYPLILTSSVTEEVLDINQQTALQSQHAQAVMLGWTLGAQVVRTSKNGSLLGWSDTGSGSGNLER